MAEIVGLTASIIQIVGASAKLSTALYQFAGSAARADQEIADIAGDVEITAHVLESVGKVFENKDSQSIISKKAVQDANSLVKRCETVFKEISEVVDKRRKLRKDGKKSLSALGKFTWPMKEQRVELLRKRLESLKNNLMLLLHVLQFADGQAKGQLEKSVIEEEYRKIRELHQRQQESVKNLEILEGKLGRVKLQADVTSPGFNNLFTTSSLLCQQNVVQWDNQLNAKLNTEKSALTDIVESSDSDETATDDKEEHFTISELSQCAKQVQTLLSRISELQYTFEAKQPTIHCPKKRVRKLYRRFCREFESQMILASSNAPQLAGIETRLELTSRQLQAAAQQTIADHLTDAEPKSTESADIEGFDPFVQQNSSYGDLYQPDVRPHWALSMEPSTSFSNLGPVYRRRGVRHPPDKPPIHTVQGPRHAQRASTDDMPTPVSVSNPRSPIWLAPEARRLSISSQDGDDVMSPRRNHVYKRSEQPPRNPDGKMICKHTECADLIFNRKSEWSKHMDMHDRPYKCNAKGCEKLAGFTYSGGLLRHEREVHKMHGGTRKSLYCPFKDCKRSSGSGFSRKENLAEHIRRIHRRTSMSSDMGSLVMPRPESFAESSTEGNLPSEEQNEDEALHSVKRKRSFEEGVSDTYNELDGRAGAKRLRRDNDEKDTRLRQLEAAVTALQNHRHSAPFQVVEKESKREKEGVECEEERSDIVNILLEKWTVRA